jgi:hypothetical protein
MRSPLERVALIMEVGECDFARACQLLRINPVDVLKARLAVMTESEFGEFCKAKGPPRKQDTAHVVTQQEICSKLRQLSDEEFRRIGLLGWPSRFL